MTGLLSQPNYKRHLLFATALHLSQALRLGFEHGFLLSQLGVIGLRLVSHLLGLHHLLLLLLLSVLLLNLLRFAVHDILQLFD